MHLASTFHYFSLEVFSAFTFLYTLAVDAPTSSSVWYFDVADVSLLCNILCHCLLYSALPLIRTGILRLQTTIDFSFYVYAWLSAWQSLPMISYKIICLMIKLSVDVLAWHICWAHVACTRYYKWQRSLTKRLKALAILITIYVIYL